MIQNSDEKCPTQAAVRTYVGNLSAINPGGNNGTFTISGNLTVSGTTTTVNTTNTTVSDQLLELGNGRTGAPSGDSGIIIERGDQNNAFIGYDESADKFTLGTTTATGASTGDIGDLVAGTIVANLEGTVTGNASTASNLTGTPNISVGTIDATDITGTGTITDGKGDVRKIITKTNGTNNYNLEVSDAGKAVVSSADIVVPNAIFSAGDAITVINSASSNMAVTQGSNVTMYNTADGSTGNRTLAGKGMATIYFTGSSTAYISGAGLT